MRFFIKILFFVLAYCYESLLAKNILPMYPIYEEQNIVAYSSNEVDLYFIPPFNFTVNRQKNYPTVWINHNDDRSEIRILLEPNYSRSMKWIRKTRESAPNTIFLPMKAIVDEIQLFLPSGLGHVEAQLTPDLPFNDITGVYYRISFNRDQFKNFLKISRSGLALQGFIGITYSISTVFQKSVLPLTIDLKNLDLAEQSEFRPTE